ncbi:MAG: hypothetical protein ABIH83_05140 [Candidatus Micrarchaeota archaeon]
MSDKCCKSEEIEKINAGIVFKHIFSANPKWIPERHLVLFTAISTVFLLSLLFIMYIGLWSSIENFDTMFLPLLALGAISSAIIIGTGYHFNAYKNPVSCAIGMMEGMSFGMMSGFIIGALVGATNGMFWGCVVGMFASSVIGIWAGRCCGVMGVMEGMMGGIMGGTMGAMISVMLLADPLPIFIALLVAMCSIVLIALAYMRIVEYGNIGSATNVGRLTSIASTSMIFFLLLTFFMIYGPKSGPVWGF